MRSFRLSTPKNQLQGMVNGVYANHKNDSLPNKLKYSGKIALVLQFTFASVVNHH